MSEPTTDTTDVQVPAGSIELELSNHLEWKGTAYKPGDKVTVTRDEARGIIAAGYSTADADDAAAVARALQLGPNDGRSAPGTRLEASSSGTTLTGPEGDTLQTTELGQWEQLASLEPRDGRSTEPDDTWHVPELEALADMLELDKTGGKAALLGRVVQRISG